jgi:hypothetical protein
MSRSGPPSVLERGLHGHACPDRSLKLPPFRKREQCCPTPKVLELEERRSDHERHVLIVIIAASLFLSASSAHRPGAPAKLPMSNS